MLKNRSCPEQPGVKNAILSLSILFSPPAGDHQRLRLGLSALEPTLRAVPPGALARHRGYDVDEAMVLGTGVAEGLDKARSALP